MSWNDVIAWTHQRAPEGASAEEAVCGQFSGLTYDWMDADGAYGRGWLLTLAELVLLVSLRIETGYSEVRLAEVDRILSTLVDARP